MARSPEIKAVLIDPDDRALLMKRLGNEQVEEIEATLRHGHTVLVDSHTWAVATLDARESGEKPAPGKLTIF